MAYHGYIPIMKNFLRGISGPVSVLEIGVDKGVTFLSLAAYLARVKKEFRIIGIDVIVQDSVSITANNLDLLPDQKASLVTGNSVEAMPELVRVGAKFDLILIDGDHNYHTVTQELAHVCGLVSDIGMIIMDDYNGAWSEQDLWYSERPGYEGVSGATQRVESEKQGVKAAVDDWLTRNEDWTKVELMKGEPVVLVRKSMLVSGDNGSVMIDIGSRATSN